MSWFLEYCLSCEDVHMELKENYCLTVGLPVLRAPFIWQKENRTIKFCDLCVWRIKIFIHVDVLINL